MGCCLGTPQISLEAQNADLNDDGLIQKTEMASFIARNEKLYMMLSVNLQLSVDRCQTIATNVAYQMSKRSDPNGSLRDLSEATRLRDPALEEFDRFLKFLEEPKGQQEFFQRTVFSSFDVDDNGYIEEKEIDDFLDVFYHAGSIFAGDTRLPCKARLKEEVMRQLDTNGDGRLDFSELRTLISGGARAGLSFTDSDYELDDDDDDDQADEKEMAKEAETKTMNDTALPLSRSTSNPKDESVQSLARSESKTRPESSPLPESKKKSDSGRSLSRSNHRPGPSSDGETRRPANFSERTRSTSRNPSSDGEVRKSSSSTRTRSVPRNPSSDGDVRKSSSSGRERSKSRNRSGSS